MAIRFECPHCGRALSAAEPHAGRRAQCVRCKAVVRVPASAATIDRNGPARAESAFEEFAVKRIAGAAEDDIDMTPMIDVVFQLLIFFMVTAAFSLQKSLPVPVPEDTTAASAAAPADDDFVTVRVAADDGLWVDDALAVSRQDLIAKLKKARGSDRNGRRRMLVLASPDAHHSAVVAALDGGNSAGMDEVYLAADDGS